MNLLNTEKATLRNKMLNKISVYAKQQNNIQSAISLVENFKVFLSNNSIEKHQIIALYYPLPNEISTLSIIEYLCKAGYKVALPYMAKEDNILAFTKFNLLDPLIENKFKIKEPKNIINCVPNVVIAPLLAFDAKGNRLGRGKGYYDKTLTVLRKTNQVTYFGMGYSFQEVKSVPNTPFDVPLAGIITEEKYQKFS